MTAEETLSSTLPKPAKPDRPFGGWLSDSFAAASYGCKSLGAAYVTGNSYFGRATACAKAPKIVEAERQIKRVQPYLEWLSKDSGAPVDGPGLNTSIALLYSFAQSPAPVPIMSVGNDGQPALYISAADFSVEVQISGNEIEYYLRNGSEDHFDEEVVEDGRIPPKLLGYIYSRCAHNE